MNRSIRQNIPLSQAQAGSEVVVQRIDGGHGIVQRLAEMGVRSGQKLKVVRGRGPMIIEVKGHRLVIGHGMVRRILVVQDG